MKSNKVTKLIEILINDYEKTNGSARFEMKKNDGIFIFTQVDQNLLDSIRYQRNDLIGKTFSVLPLKKHWIEEMPAIYEKVWNGEETGYYSFPYSNEKIILVVALRPIQVNGTTDRIEGRCAPLENNEFDSGFTGTMIIP